MKLYFFDLFFTSTIYVSCNYCFMWLLQLMMVFVNYTCLLTSLYCPHIWFFLACINVANAFFYKKAPSTLLPKVLYVWITLTKTCSISLVKSLRNRDIIMQDDAYLLPLEFTQLLEVESKTMKIILWQLLHLVCLTS
jgi:hypothetical protein